MLRAILIVMIALLAPTARADDEKYLELKAKYEALQKQYDQLKIEHEATKEAIAKAIDDLRKPFLENKPKPPAPLPEGLTGRVTAYKDGSVSLNIGIDAGLTNGAKLDIHRDDKDDPRLLGTLIVERVYPKEAVAKFHPADARRSIAKLHADELPKVGDTVGKVGIKAK